MNWGRGASGRGPASGVVGKNLSLPELSRVALAVWNILRRGILDGCGMCRRGRNNFAPWGHWAVSGDILVIAVGVRVLDVVGQGQGCC